MKCPDCNSDAIFRTKTNDKLITIKIKCTKCNRKVIRTGKRGDYNSLRERVFVIWNNSISCGINGEEFD